MKFSKIDSVEIISLDEPMELIDIEVEDDHTFFVSEDAQTFVLTHNSGAPDIDSDVSDRDKVIPALQEQYGYNNVLPVSTINRFKLKNLTKDVAKFFGIQFEEVNNATRTVEQDVRKATQKEGDDKNAFVLQFDDAMKHSQSYREFIERHPELADSIKALLKEQRSLGRHAGGILILDEANEHVPIITAKGEPQVPWSEGVSEKTLEKLGLLKIDLLGLETLRLIERSISLIIQDQGGVVEVEVGNQIKRYLPDEIVQLSDGTNKLAKDLCEDDDIIV